MRAPGVPFASLRESARARIAELEAALPGPVELRKTRNKLEAQFGAMDSGYQVGDLARVSICRLVDRGAGALSNRDRFRLSYALSQKFDELGHKCLLESRSHITPLFEHWENADAHKRLKPGTWRGLLCSYLQFDGDRAQNRSGWHRLRALLTHSRGRLVSRSGHPPLWMKLVESHKDILGDQPCSSHARNLANGSSSSVEEIRRDLALPDGSWFWTELVETAMGSLERSSDSVVRRAIPALVGLLEQAGSHRDKGLALLLDRYASCASRERNEALLEFALRHWGSPQLQRQRLWSLVNASTKKLIAGWLALEDLQHFFEVCLGNKRVARERLKYWLRFIHLATFTQILLGSDLQNSRDPDVREFREKKQDRIGRLRGTSDSNNAFMMMINGYLVVEFSEIGNATYLYKRGQVPFEEGKREYDVRSELKDRSAGTSMRHREGWQQRFDERLEEWNIRPAESNSRPADAVAQSNVIRRTVVPTYERQGASILPSEATDIQSNFPAEIVVWMKRARVEIVDHRERGGNLWLQTRFPGWDIDERLRRLGFKWKERKGYYRA